MRACDVHVRAPINCRRSGGTLHPSAQPPTALQLEAWLQGDLPPHGDSPNREQRLRRRRAASTGRS
eukprot:6803256-Prymnesium_polylepis.1